MSSPSFVVRPAEAADLASWRQLRRALWPDATDSAHDHEIAEILADAERYETFIVFSDTHTPVGFAEASIRHDYVNGCETSPVLFLEGIYVTPAVRRRGVAKALFECVERWGASHGCEEFASDTAIDNVGIQALHVALGFEETERVVYFRKPIRK
ncbi:aminoglycoside 6'-N-acetyltransferase [Pandoraea pnomenusa]|uniref:aminoglycoside 6'-N-acetyltransferase n=1 Tax=Pandoraea pnomenusa TaxID=93220 RepID=UPI0033400891